MDSPAPATPRTRRFRLRRIVPVVLGVALAAVALTGCVAVNSVTFVQNGALGPINIVIKGCGSKAATTGCGLGHTNLESNTTGTGQVLLGVQIKSDFVPPATFKTDLPDNQPFTLSPSYTAELTRLRPPDPGTKWAGYISDARTYAPGKAVTGRVPIVRPPLADGSPSPSGFGVLWVIGARGVIQDFPADRPVKCGDSLTTAPLDGDLTICEDAEGGAGQSGFHDFAFLTPAPVTVQPGQTATIPVTGKLTGPAAPTINFALAASTTLPGATALTNVPALAPPGESTTSVTVSVPVPASAKPGTYPVTLTGTLATGETRSATGTLIVPGAGGGTAGQALLSDLKVSRTTIFSSRGAAPAVISVTLSDPGRLTILLERQAAGRRKNRRCVPPTSALRRAGAPRCIRFIQVSSQTRTGLGAGVTKVSISGRSGGRRRASGTYRVTLTSLSSTGVASLPLRTTLIITR